LTEGSDTGKFGSDVVREGTQGNLVGSDFFIVGESNRKREEAVVGGVLFLEIIEEEINRLKVKVNRLNKARI